MVSLVIGVLAFIAGVWAAPKIRTDIVEMEAFVEAKAKAAKSAVKAKAQKGIEKL